MAAPLRSMLDAGVALEPVWENAHRSAAFRVPEGAYPLVLAKLQEIRGSALLVVTATGREAAQYAESFAAYSNARVMEFPAWETLPHERLSPTPETVGKRLAVLAALGDERAGAGAALPLVVFASVRAALQPIIGGLERVPSLTFKRETEPVDDNGAPVGDIAEALTALAYTRVDMVTRRGEFAIRGGIVDVFAAHSDAAVRIDLFGDEVDEIRHFSVSDQRSDDTELDEYTVLPSRELLLTEAVQQRAKTLAAEYPAAQEMCEKIAAGVPVEGMESLAAALTGRMLALTEYLPSDAGIALLAPEKIATRAEHLKDTNREFLEAAWGAASAGGAVPVEVAGSDFYTLEELRESAGDRPWWQLSTFGDDAALQAPIAPAQSFAGDPAAALEYATQLHSDGWRVVLAVHGEAIAQRAAELLAGAGIDAETVQSLPSATNETDATQNDAKSQNSAILDKNATKNIDNPPKNNAISICIAKIQSGYLLEEERIAVISETDFFGKQALATVPKKRKTRRNVAQIVDPLQLKAGDIVVHEVHGVGRFLELKQYSLGSPGGARAQNPDAPRDYLVLEYAPNKRGLPADQLLVPTDQLDQLSKYVGGESPALSKLGGSDWASTKQKARKAVRDIAAGLIRLYAERARTRGHAFSPDTAWQREMEDAFVYAETADQLTAISEVKADMEKPTPMDRLVLGDVGFGKTEIAVRASFKAVQDGKQVAFLAPTTLLVKQHLDTLQQRFAGFPVQLRALSRFQTPKEAQETLDGLAAGAVDVVVGTHRLLSKDVSYRDLGLIIIDEEQRFGVEHKDALKKLKTNVDVLSMSATPIPRTLEMAVTGIREMSQLTTPPEDRHPILTFVGARNDAQIAAAIHREIMREGQVFFVHNRVQSISRVARQIQELVPEARVAVAHGKLSERQLEDVVLDFYERKYDVLVSTTIIETGLDIANANTIIIDNADKYGLSQLHQLRGRVGRSRDRAYAYFMYDPQKPLSEQAHQRLETIARHNDLGSGMQVAIKDLELRGAGNLLGAEQAGHIAGVGFDLYLRMVGEAIDVFKGEKRVETREMQLEIPVDARIPTEYIESERLRLEAYQKLAACAHPSTGVEQLQGVQEELEDRYGALPAAVERLLALTALRRRLAELGIVRAIVQYNELRIAPVELSTSRSMRLRRMYPGASVAEHEKTLRVPLPAALCSGSGMRVSPLAGARGADQAADGDMVGWIDRLVTAILVPDADPV